MPLAGNEEYGEGNLGSEGLAEAGLFRWHLLSPDPLTLKGTNDV
jgi:hypothetical protein